MDIQATGSRPWRLVATAALVLAAVAVAACDLGRAQATASPANPSANAATSDDPVGGACSATDLAVSGGPWSAAAGSRGAEVVVENQGSAPCTLPAAAQVTVVDGASQPVAETEPAAPQGPALEPGGTATFTILFGNWCDANAALPLQVVLETGAGGVRIQGLDLAEADLPPCNGPGLPPVLTAQPWTTG